MTFDFSAYACACKTLIKISKSCPAGLHWDNNAKVCNWPNAAKCQPVTKTDAPTNAPTVTRKTY